MRFHKRNFQILIEAYPEKRGKLVCNRAKISNFLFVLWKRIEPWQVDKSMLKTNNSNVSHNSVPRAQWKRWHKYVKKGRSHFHFLRLCENMWLEYWWVTEKIWECEEIRWCFFFFDIWWKQDHGGIESSYRGARQIQGREKSKYYWFSLIQNKVEMEIQFQS